MASSGTGDCTLATCPVEEGWLSSPPPVEGTAFLLAAFATLVPVNLWIGARSRTAVYSLSLSLGLLLEVLGYSGMLLLRQNLASKSFFVLSLIGTAVGPTLITAAIYAILPHILAIYGSDLSIPLEPLWLNYFFLAFDVFTIAFQVVGCVFAAGGHNRVEIQQGVNVLIVGFAIQILSLVGFFGLYFWFMSRVFRHREILDPRFCSVYLSARFKTALLFTQLALALILARTVARIIQISGGLASASSQSHTFTLVLDGALVLVAAIIVTVFPPGPTFGRAWGTTSPSKKKARRHHLAHLNHPAQRSPGSPLLTMRPSPAASPNEYRFGYNAANNNNNNNKEPRSPPPSVTTDAGSMGQSGLCGTGRYSHRRQAAAQPMGAAAPPPYERPLGNITRVPFVPPRALTLSQQYGNGQIVESEVTIAHGSDGSKTGGSAGSGGGPSGRTRTRSSPRSGDAMVQHDSIW
ncbi:hypothetical protein KVR01_001748 [Diaporthe batatas]|uniref:uncharacterized protein n=1 Tax=Diaporthe batatas TaxID=748121 RepID=UPI001D0587E0|nr:uncharacterized protein KVR01_001748 [Diaporthe batatas]KAG8168999.1 hypothetical protein KVR01_001748 [Diaporthe batatas]